MDFTLTQDTSTTSTAYNYHGYSTPSFSSHKQFWLRRYHAWTKAEHTDHDNDSVYDGILHSDDHIPSSLYDEDEPHPQPEQADDSFEQTTFDPTEPGVYPRMGNLSYAQDENWARMDWMLRGVKMWIVTRSLFQWALASTPDTCSSIPHPDSSSRRHSVSTQSTPSVYSDIDLDDTTPFYAPTTSTIPDDGNFTANDNQDETGDDDDVQEFVGYSEDLESDLESDATLVDSEQNSPLGLSNSKQLPPLFLPHHHHHLSHSTSSSSSPTSAQSITPSSPFSTSVFLPTDDDFGYSERRHREEEVEGEFNYIRRIRMGQVDQWKYLLGISTTYSSSSSSSKPLISVGNHLYDASSALIDDFLSSSSSRSISSSSSTTSRPSSSSSSYNSNPTHPPPPPTTTRSLLVDDSDSEEFDIENYDHDFEHDFDFDFERDCAGSGYGYIPSRPQSPKFFFLDEDDDEGGGDGEEGLIYNTLHHQQQHIRQRSLSPKWRFHDDEE
ncbi:hypothetical protein C8Q75DRAFT_812095 [Abortiporus biennis]|nr:hypothetical protein C8Q75DRAFT_812095 [Abortiporus biennis]